MWTQLSPEKGHTYPHPILAHVYCGQTAGWTKTPLGTEVDLAWFANYLSDRFQRVVQPPVYTEWMPVTRGAPQGGGLSPRFFNTYVKDLPKAVQSQSMQFADDLTVSEQSAISSKSDPG